MIKCFSGEYRFLSDFYLIEIEYEGRLYPSVEHAYQAAKTINELDRIRIAEASTPGRAKRLGYKVTLRPEWESIKVAVMHAIVARKFADPELAKLLDNTGNVMLEEGNTWHDNTWGNCTCRKCDDITGKNLLGKILMTVRRANKIFFVDTDTTSEVE